MKPFPSIFQGVLVGFFWSEIPAVLVMDGAASYFPLPYFPMFENFVKWYAQSSQDPHFNRGYDEEAEVEGYELWFRSMITFEMCLKLPYFIVALHKLRTWRNLDDHYPEWFRVASLAYVARAITAFLPTWVVVLFQDDNRSFAHRLVVGCVYLPYLLIPLVLAYFVAVPSSEAFGDSRIVLTDMKKQRKALITISFIRICHILWDSLKQPMELWEKAFTFCEIFLQIPFLILMLRAIMVCRDSSFPSWFPSACIVFGMHDTTILVPRCVCSVASVSAGAHLATWRTLVSSFLFSTRVLLNVWITFAFTSVAWNSGTNLCTERSGKED